MTNLKEIQGKMAHDPHNYMFSYSKSKHQVLWVPGPVIIGAGPSGLAAAACLKEQGIPSIIIERSNCIASLWQLKTYNRLRLHLPKRFCELPLMPFPKEYPSYPDKQQFVEYLDAYAKRFGIEPVFDSCVERGEYDESIGMWRVKSVGMKSGEVVEYVCQWLVVATGENAEVVVPEIEGLVEFSGEVKHTSEYKSGNVYKGKKVLVVGCGNSGMEVCLDLCNHNAKPSLVVRDAVHVLPRDMFGNSTFGLSMWLLKWLPVKLVDRFLLFVSWLILGNTAKFGLDRPVLGPLELKNISGKTPVLDVGALAKIKCGDIKMYPSIQQIGNHSVHFSNGKTENFDAIILATGYKSNVPSWLKEKEMFSERDGYPRRPFPHGWKGAHGLYAVGFSKRGLLGASADAKRIAEDISKCLKVKSSHLKTTVNKGSLSLQP